VITLKATVYSLPVCPDCMMAKIYLEQLNVEFDEVDLSRDRALADELIEITGQRKAPIIKIDDRYICGFDKEKINKAVQG